MVYWRLQGQDLRKAWAHPQTYLTQDEKFGRILQRTDVLQYQKRWRLYQHVDLPHAEVVTCPEDEQLLHLHDPGFHRNRTDTTFLPHVMLELLSQDGRGASSEVPELRTIAEVVSRVGTFEEGYATEAISSVLQGNSPSPASAHVFEFLGSGLARDLLSVISWTEHCIDLHPNCSVFVPGEKNKMVRLVRKATGAHSSHKSYPFEVWWTPRHVILRIRENRWTLPYEAFLELQAKLSDLLSILIYAHSAQGLYLPADSGVQVLRAVRLLCEYHVQDPLYFFDVVKTLEGLGIGQILREAEMWSTPNDEFLRETLAGLINKPDGHAFATRWVHLMSTLSVPLQAELSCLSKITGHPFVDTAGGVAKVKARATAPAVFAEGMDLHLSDLSKYQFCRAHYAKRRTWPAVTDQSECPSHLRQMMEGNLNPDDASVARSHGQELCPRDYRMIVFEKAATMDLFENPIPLLKDRTITPRLEEMVSVHIKPMLSRALSIPMSPRVTAADRIKATSLLCHFITSTMGELGYEEFLEAYRDDERFDLPLVKSALLLKLVSKELELKSNDPRQFAAQTVVDRHRRQVTEAAVGSFLGAYSNEHTMTSTDVKFQQQLAALRRWGMTHPGSTTLVISVDVKAWNNGFRAFLVDAVMSSTLAAYYGDPILEAVHASYENTHYYSIEGQNFIDYWFGQGGGIEGLSQYTWVWVYLIMSHSIFARWEYKHTFLCHGDDFRAYISIPNSVVEARGMAAVKTEIINEVKAGLADFNLEVKAHDSYGSSTFGSFKKIMSLDGIVLPTSFRKIQKCHSSMDITLPTLDDYVGTCFSTAHGSCLTAPTMVPAYLTALFWALKHMVSHPDYSRLTVSQMAVLLITPANLGGFPTLSPENLAIRASADQTADYINRYEYARRVAPDLASIMAYFLFQPMGKASPDPSSRVPLSQLLEDQYAFPLSRPTLPLTLLRADMLPHLRRIVRNELLQEILEQAEVVADSTVETALAESPVWSAALAAEIHAQGPQALVSDFVTKFESGRSILQLLLVAKASKGEVTRTFRRCMRQDTKLHRWRIDLVKGAHGMSEALVEAVMALPLEFRPSDGPARRCPVRIRETLATVAWGRVIETAVTAPPRHLVKVMSASAALSDNPGSAHFLVEVESADPHPALPEAAYQRGRGEPYVAGTTSSSTQAGSLTYPVNDPLARRLSDLAVLKSWADTPLEPIDGGLPVPDDLRHLALYYMKAFAPEDVVSTICSAGPTRLRGCRLHHIHTRAGRSEIAMNLSSGWFSKIRVNTDSNQVYARASVRHNINYLHVVCHIRVVAMNALMWGKGGGPSDGSYYAVTPSCEHCHGAYIEHPMVFNSDRLITSSPPLMHNLAVVQRELDRVVSAVRAYGSGHDRLQSQIDVTDDGLRQVACQIKCHQFALEQNRLFAEVRDVFGFQGMALTHRDVTELAPLSLSSATSLSQRDLRKIPISVLGREIAGLAGVLYSAARTSYSITDWFSYEAPAITPSRLPWYPLVCYIQESGFTASFLSQLATYADAPLPEHGCANVVATVRSVGSLCPSLLGLRAPRTLTMAVDADISAVALVSRLRDWLIRRWSQFHTRVWAGAQEDYGPHSNHVRDYQFWREIFAQIHLPLVAVEPILRDLRSESRRSRIRLFPLMEHYRGTPDEHPPHGAGISNALTAISEQVLDWPEEVERPTLEELQQHALTGVPRLGLFRIEHLDCEALSGAEVNSVVESMPLAFTLDTEGPEREATTTDWNLLGPMPQEANWRLLAPHRQLRYEDLGPARVAPGAAISSYPSRPEVSLSADTDISAEALEVFEAAGWAPRDETLSLVVLEDRRGDLTRWLLSRYPQATAIYVAWRRGISLELPISLRASEELRSRVIARLQGMGLDRLSQEGYVETFLQAHPGPHALFVCRSPPGESPEQQSQAIVALLLLIIRSGTRQCGVWIRFPSGPPPHLLGTLTALSTITSTLWVGSPCVGQDRDLLCLVGQGCRARPQEEMPSMPAVSMRHLENADAAIQGRDTLREQGMEYDDGAVIPFSAEGPWSPPTPEDSIRRLVAVFDREFGVVLVVRPLRGIYEQIVNAERGLHVALRTESSVLNEIHRRVCTWAGVHLTLDLARALNGTDNNTAVPRSIVEHLCQNIRSTLNRTVPRGWRAAVRWQETPELVVMLPHEDMSEARWTRAPLWARMKHYAILSASWLHLARGDGL